MDADLEIMTGATQKIYSLSGLSSKQKTRLRQLCGLLALRCALVVLSRPLPSNGALTQEYQQITRHLIEAMAGLSGMPCLENDAALLNPAAINTPDDVSDRLTRIHAAWPAPEKPSLGPVLDLLGRLSNGEFPPERPVLWEDEITVLGANDGQGQTLTLHAQLLAGRGEVYPSLQEFGLVPMDEDFRQAPNRAWKEAIGSAERPHFHPASHDVRWWLEGDGLAQGCSGASLGGACGVLFWYMLQRQRVPRGFAITAQWDRDTPGQWKAVGRVGLKVEAALKRTGNRTILRVIVHEDDLPEARAAVEKAQRDRDLAVARADSLAAAVAAIDGFYAAQRERFLRGYLPRRDKLQLYFDDYGPATPFGGRDFRDLDGFLDMPSTTRTRLLVHGPAGTGKSTLLVRWWSRLSVRTDWHTIFIPICDRHGLRVEDDVYDILLHQLVAIYDQKPDELQGLKRDQIANLLDHPPPHDRRILIILDGLDELFQEKDREAVAGLFARAADKPWLRIAIAAKDHDSQPDHWLKLLKWNDAGQRLVYPLANLDEAGVKAAAASVGAVLTDGEAEALHRCTGGYPMLVGALLRLHRDSRGQFSWTDLEEDEPPDEVSSGIDKAMERFFGFIQRAAEAKGENTWDMTRRLLGTLALARGGLTESEWKLRAGVTPREATYYRSARTLLACLVRRTTQRERGESVERLFFYHPEFGRSFRDTQMEPRNAKGVAADF
jgi:NACHT domain